MDKSVMTNTKIVLFMRRIIVAAVKPQQMIENIGEISVPGALQED